MTIRVLFVDDEVNVLSGLRRMLRGQRHVWDMHFASGGSAALEMMAAQPFEVIVTDMRMPGIDGAELLTQVSERFPGTVRLVLSGQSEHEKIFRAIGPAHQFMSKPCDPEVLISTIDRACGLQSELHSESLKRVTSKIGTLPSLPSIYRELVQELESERTSMERVGDMIGGDIAMTAKVLQLVNSSFFGLAQHVTCPKHAVSLLGLNIIRPLVLIANAFSEYTDEEVSGFSLEQSIHHSLAVATAARKIAIAEVECGHIVDDAYIAGMLHDIGKLILSANLPTDFKAALEVSHSEHCALWQAELQVFGTTHAEVGAHLLGLWGLPNPIVEAVTFHHRPCDSGAGSFNALTAVHVANLFQRLAFPGDETDAEPQWDRNYMETLQVTDRLDEWAALVGSEMLT
jgi:putative nucleotidyltransferase with HDIG domain